MSQLRKALERIDGQDGKHRNCGETCGTRVVYDAARDHLSCGTITDEMVEAVRQVFRDAGHKPPFDQQYAELALEAAALRVEDE